MKEKNRKGKGEGASDDELKSLIDYYFYNSTGRHNGELAEQRRTALEYYYALPLGNEVDGRSQIVSHDVFEVVEWTLPSLLRVFLSGENVVEFQPTTQATPEGAQKAEAEATQATDYINHLFLNENDGFTVLYDMFKDALIEKTGTAKVWWDDTPEHKFEEYNGLDEMDLQKLIMDDDVEVQEADSDIDEQGQTFYSVKIRRLITEGRIRVEQIPPEEFLVMRRAKDLDSAEAIFHRRQVTKTELKNMFPNIPAEEIDELQGDEDQEWDEEYQSRHNFDDIYDTDDNTSERMLGKKVWLTEAYMYVDGDGDGEAEYRKITKAGNKILDNEEIEDHPFVSITPIPIPHKHYGISQADITVDLQKMKTAIIRNILDNIYQTNNSRTIIHDGMVNIDDLLTNRPGGVIRARTIPGQAVMPFPTAPLPQGTFDLLEYADQIRDGRSGSTKFNQGLNEASLNHAKSGPMLQQMNASVARLELISRVFAEYKGGIKLLFKKMYDLVRKHQTKTQIIRLRGQWIPIEPSSWDGSCRVDMEVGLGHGNKEVDINILDRIAQQIGALRQDPEFRTLVTPENVYNLFAEAVKTMGKKNPDKYITHPSRAPKPQPQQDPKVEVEKMKAQAAQQKLQGEMQLDKQEAEQRQKEFQMDQMMNQQKMQMEQQKFEHEKEMHYLNMQMEKLEAMLKMAELQVESAQERSIKLGND